MPGSQPHPVSYKPLKCSGVSPSCVYSTRRRTRLVTTGLNAAKDVVEAGPGSTQHLVVALNNPTHKQCDTMTKDATVRLLPLRLQTVADRPVRAGTRPAHMLAERGFPVSEVSSACDTKSSPEKLLRPRKIRTLRSGRISRVVSRAATSMGANKMRVAAYVVRDVPETATWSGDRGGSAAAWKLPRRVRSVGVRPDARASDRTAPESVLSVVTRPYRDEVADL